MYNYYNSSLSIMSNRMRSTPASSSLLHSWPMLAQLAGIWTSAFLNVSRGVIRSPPRRLRLRYHYHRHYRHCCGRNRSMMVVIRQWLSVCPCFGTGWSVFCVTARRKQGGTKACVAIIGVVFERRYHGHLDDQRSVAIVFLIAIPRR